MQRAGGLTPAAFGEGAVFLRESLKEREQEQIETLVRRLQADLVSLSLQTATSGGTETLLHRGGAAGPASRNGGGWSHGY